MVATALTIPLAALAVVSAGAWPVDVIPAAAKSSPLAFVFSPVRRLRSSAAAHRNVMSCAPSSPSKSHRHCNNCNNRLTRLHATIDDSQLQSDVVERLELHDQFARWRFLQKLLEAELPASDVEDVLLLSLNAYLRHGPTAASANNKNENGGNASPVLTDDQRTAMEGLIEAMVSISDGIGDSRFLHLLVLPPVDYESLEIDVDEPQQDELIKADPAAISILEQIEHLLPDPVEDEEAHKSAWDVVIDLYGRESVRVREEALQREKEGNIVRSDGESISLKCGRENLQWRTLCTVGRALVHYDFLTKGVLKEGTFQ